MATQPTQNPVPSESPRDLKFNAGKIDEFVTSLALQYIDRFGDAHYTIEGIKQLAFEAMSQFGYVTISSFEDGATLTDPNQALLWESNGEYYKWTGNLPKTVPAGSTPDSTGGIGPGAWLSIGDSLLRSMLASSTGAQLIGTNHRGTLQQDLDAIDRRPDGYSNDLSVVLANGQDVEINKDYDLQSALTPGDYQVIRGVGGSVENTGKARAIFIATKQGVKVRDFRCTGKIVNGDTTNGNVAYAISAEDSSNLLIDGVDTSSYTGSIELTRCTDSVVRNVYSRANRYHPNVVAGGYGVLISGSSRILIDGINFEADSTKADLGRHSFYVSVVQDGETFCEDIIIRNVIARYRDLDNRNMHSGVIRKSNRVLIDGFNINGSNSGFAINTDDGVVQDLQIRNGHFKIFQYSDDAAVSGIGGGADGDYNKLVGLRVDNVTFEFEGKAGATITAYRMHPLNLTCRNSQFTNLRIKSRGDSTAILLGACTGLLFDGIQDFVTAGNPTQPLIRFQGAASTISVKNIQTTRPVFAGLDNVTDLTVDFDRFARVVSNNGTITLTDSNSLISSCSVTGTGEITVIFKRHVTETAVRTASLGAASVAGLIMLPEIVGRTLKMRFYNGSGVLVNLSAAIVGADISLHS
ncbi:tail fiber/spike domain-containing protein [Mixta calida]|uniref:tail fiber/spike domain-containing protein n=1 Tax=Mixta calida TaxID=665913 RepID=UPI00403B13D6